MNNPTDAEHRADQALRSPLDYAHLHDCVFESVERSFDDATLRRLFLALPVSIQELAVQWGLSDTGVRDDIYGWLQVNQTVLRTLTDHDS